jgi:gallate decarboxylase subunit D
MITSGNGKTKVWLKKQKIEDDLLIIVGGGEKSHIGTTILCVPNKKCQILKYGTHKDHIVIKPIAEKACRKYKKVVVAVGGIHINNASKKEIDEVIKNCKLLEKKL